MNHDSLPPLHGVWQIVRAELGGQPMPADAAAHVELTFSFDGYAVSFGRETTDEGIYTVTTGQPHHRITMTGRSGVNSGRTLPGIMQLQGNLLRLCFALEGNTPPEEFAAPAGTVHYLVTYRRKSS
ncbi:MAG: TIGR03067 domain-containing protein [Opitutaceae bacterium]|nr:TIGR03067 domain-containing protein [Opitutaceae bacterium]MBP9914483.1 TIGR03067 domain-containing protein [Opitutaceae bacterium]